MASGAASAVAALRVCAERHPPVTCARCPLCLARGIQATCAVKHSIIDEDVCSHYLGCPLDVHEWDRARPLLDFSRVQAVCRGCALPVPARPTEPADASGAEEPHHGGPTVDRHELSGWN